MAPTYFNKPFFPFTLSWQVSTEDLNKYNALAQQQAKKLFPTLNMSKFYAAENADPLVFCHFAENIQDQIYDQVGQVPIMWNRPLRVAPSMPNTYIYISLHLMKRPGDVCNA